MVTKKYICAVAGKSGGHIIPAATLCQNFLKDNQDFNVLFFSTNSKLDSEIISKYSFVNNHIKLEIDGISKNPIKLIKFNFNLIISFFKSFKILKKLKPIKVISTGGLVSIPVCLSAKLLRIPVEIYELNVIPGKATKFLSKFDVKIFTVFSNTCNYFNNKTGKDNCDLVNYPVRFVQENIIPKDIAIKKINQDLKPDNHFDSNKKTIFIIGGSQGSVSINKIVKDFFKSNNESKNLYQVIHQTGQSQVEELEKFYQEHKITNLVFSFKNNLEYYYCASNIIISRAGAGSLFEILFFSQNLENKKAIIIPLENTADNHQVENAKAIAKDYPEIFVVKRQNNLKNNLLD